MTLGVFQLLAFHLGWGALPWRRKRIVWYFANLALGCGAAYGLLLLQQQGDAAGWSRLALVLLLAVSLWSWSHRGNGNTLAGGNGAAFGSHRPHGDVVARAVSISAGGLIAAALYDAWTSSVVLTPAATMVGMILQSLQLLCEQQRLSAQMERSQWQQKHCLATEREESIRRQIAELLHARVQNRLLVAWYHLKRAQQLLAENPQQALKLLDAAQALVDQVREQDIRQVAHSLHPSVLKIGLAPALAALTENIGDALQVDLEIDRQVAALDQPGPQRMPEALRLSLYRIVEEALNNVYRHAEATRVLIKLQRIRDQVELRVVDNGRGLDPARFQAGLGFSAIEARVADHHGRWRLLSAPGQGCTLLVQLPLAVRQGAVAVGGES